MTRVVKSFVVEDADPFILHLYYRGLWWPGDSRGQGIIGYGINLVLL